METENLGPSSEETRASVQKELTDQSEKRKREEDTNPLWKTSLCSYFRRPGGLCSHGDACRYAHGEAELRSRPDNSWDPTSDRAKKLLKTNSVETEEQDEKDPPMVVGFYTLEKCLIGLPRKWASDNLRSFFDGKGISYKTAKKKKGMSVGFVSFSDAAQVKSAIKVLNENTTGENQIRMADAVRRSQDKKSGQEISVDHTKEQLTPSHLCIDDSIGSTVNLAGNGSADDTSGSSSNQTVKGLLSKTKSARDVVTPLADMPYSEQLEHKKNSLLQSLKRLTRNARKACPDAIPLPEWILKSREIAGLPCKLEGIVKSPLIYGYRNKCEFSVGYSVQGKRTVGFMLGNFREGVTAVEEPVNCPNVSEISCKFALIFQEFLESSKLTVWNRIDNTGFWRQLTVREGRNPSQLAVTENLENHIAEVMLIIQVCSLEVDEVIMQSEFKRMVEALVQGAAACSPSLPLTTLVVQDHKGVSNAAPADCPIFSLPLTESEEHSFTWKEDASVARIHDYLLNLRFCISPTAFFQVNTLAAEKLYTLAGDWADLGPDTLLFDICCGTGTIGLTLAHRVGMVVGIEMNDSAVSDACRNAEINGITNCRFVCGKAEDVIGGLLKEYLAVPQLHGTASDVLENQGNGDDFKEENGDHENKFLGPLSCMPTATVAADASSEKMPACSEENFSETSSGLRQNVMENINDDGGDVFIGGGRHQKNQTLAEQKATNGSNVHQFKNIVAIVDPPRVGLHPVVLKTLRTHSRLRRLVYISCNPESLVANAIELCTPTAEKPEKGKGNLRWRNMSTAGLARHRAKSMPNSEPFRPVRAVAVDLFPHTPHCEMVMLFER